VQRVASGCTASGTVPNSAAADPIAKRFFVYILANRQRGVPYVGSTGVIVRRLAEHKSKLVPGFTGTRGVLKPVYLEKYPSIDEARTREAALQLEVRSDQETES
jgi:putative endonuclease